MNRLFLISVVSGVILAIASVASSSDYVWEDPNIPFSERIESCVFDSAPDTVSVVLLDYNKITIMTLKLESDSGVPLESVGSKRFLLFTPWLGVNGKNIRIPVDIFPAEQTVQIKVGKYLKPGDNKFSFSFYLDPDYHCKNDCSGCRYFVKEISFSFFE